MQHGGIWEGILIIYGIFNIGQQWGVFFVFILVTMFTDRQWDTHRHTRMIRAQN